MKIKLSKLLIVFYILSNHFSFAQTDILLDRVLLEVEGIKNGSNNKFIGMCDPDAGFPNGPWYRAYWINDRGHLQTETHLLGDPNEGDPISSQRRGNLSLIDKDGVVVFCEGESRFSGLVTAENVAFIGIGDLENIIVSPAENFYFNLISLDIDNLQLFANHYNLDDLEKMIERMDNDSRILIDNVTFTNHNSERKIQPWREQSDYKLDQCLRRSDDSPFDDYDIRSCLDRYGVLNISSGAAIQVDRPRTFLNINNVIFKEFYNVTTIIESLSEGSDINIQNTQIIDNHTIRGTLLIGKGDNLSLSNIKIINNYHADLHLAWNSQQDDLKNLSLSNIKINNNHFAGMYLGGHDERTRNIELKNIEVANNDNNYFAAISKDFTGENILFKNNNAFDNFILATPDKSYFNINNINFINNREFSFIVVGSGRITESVIEKNSFGGFYDGNSVFCGEDLTFDNLVFNNNNSVSMKAFIFNLGNINFNNTDFINNERISNASSLFSFFEARGNFYFDGPGDDTGHSFADQVRAGLLSNPEPLESLSEYRLNFNNVNYINQNSFNFPFIIAYNSCGDFQCDERFIEVQRQMGRQITLENYQKLLDLPVNDAVSIYQFNAIDNLQCGYENDIYMCDR